ncbi:MAG: hypothetical protein RMK29_11640 [Myxococcales bacterium]|nr:hypothetical protein [Myxococcota bacterium]MDW8282360.1 hypothetical protein [Myxococcales bacterium]
MRRGTTATLFSLGLAASLPGCGGVHPEQDTDRSVEFRHHGVDSPPILQLPDWRYIPPGSGIRTSAGAGGLSDPTVNYSLALRTAAIKLVGELPTLDEIKQMEAAASTSQAHQVYVSLVRKYINDRPRFARQMVQYWRDTLRMGGSIMGFVSDTNNMRAVDLETGPRFAAQLTVEGSDMRRLFTQDRNTCPTYDVATGNFTPAPCAARDGNEGLQEGEHVGILTHPAFLAHYYSNYAFRRVRLIQELFACHKFPAEFTDKPERGDGYLYVSPWPKFSITSQERPPVFTERRRIRGPGFTRVADMRDYAWVRYGFDCASCHATMNHQAPLFMNFDGIGILRTRSMVQTPVDDAPFAQMADYVPAGEKMAWRYQKETPTIRAFGQAMAEDPEVIKCFIIRAWNRAMSRADVVNDLAIVPDAVVRELTEQFRTSLNYNLKEALLLIYTHPTFIRF